MALSGCCCCGLRGGAKAVGVFFLIITLLQLIGVITAWVLCVSVTTDSQGVGFDSPEGRFGISARETKSILGGDGGDLELNLGKLGKFGVSASQDGRVSLHTPGGDLSNSRRRHDVPGLDYLDGNEQVALIISTVYVLLCVSFNSMLIHGADHDSRCAVLSWVIFYGIHFVLWSIYALFGLIVGGVFLGGGADGVGLALLVSAGVTLPIMALLWFWWALVLTFHRELRDGTRGFKYHREVSMHEPPTALVTGPAVQQKQKAEQYA